MRQTRLWFVCLLLLSGSVFAQQVEVREAVLSNGMKFLIVERHEAPTVACGWVARVGSVNERPGITGISHLFEHLMFKGTKTIGTKDYEKGQEIRRKQDAIFAEMEKEYSELRRKLLRGEISGSIYDPENWTPRLKELRQQLLQLFEEERALIVKDELDRIYTQNGGAGLNAFTSEDQTAYFVTIPANKIELWMWLESDRLLNPVFREFYSERDVVREERRLAVESTPTGRLDEQLQAMFWQAVPYHWPVIGWASDVESISRRQAEEYFQIHYAPNNLTGVLVGDVDPDEALRLAEEYFGRIPRGAEDPPEVVTFEVEQVAEKRLVGEADTNPTVQMLFHTPAFYHKDTFPLELLTAALQGRTGRLYRSLVEEKELVVGEPMARLETQKYAGALRIAAEVKEGRTHQQVEEAVVEELEKLKAEPLGERELQKLKNQVLADSHRRLRNNFFLLLQLIVYDSNGDWRYINEAPGLLQAVTADQIQDVARRYLEPKNRTVAWYERKAGAGPVPPELASLPPQMRSAIQQQLSMIAQESDVALLQQALSQMEQMAEQVTPEMKPAFDLVTRRIRERIAELSKDEGGK
ncbi:MAG TPA: pitrilysin family protein [Acidobacteriota bacterium]|nr:pitrilysin family protein [Acidobacteriota bacterium]HRR25317.1 pitrilysin family protein [Acidobacteriota bacterium]HRR56258.1 pitrilysin family protein [Acidobacteriota bacterium]HRV07831.1 pitrilysin family protein [Acidobacteriota bacterium]